MSVEEKVLETPKGAAAFDAARASVRAQSEDQGAEPPPEDDTPTATEQPVQEPAKPADEPQPTGEEPDAILTPEELAALPEKERAKAVKWTAKLTQRSQAVSAKEKQVDKWLPLIEALESDPDAAIEQLAQHRGLSITRAEQQGIESRTAETMASLPEGMEFLKPILDEYGKKLLADIRGEITPIKQEQEQTRAKAAAMESEATLKAFTAEYPDWRKYEPQMLELGQKILPTGGVNDHEYMKMLYTLVRASANEADKTREVIEKINKSAERAEPKNSGVPSGRVAETKPANWEQMDNSQRLRAAYDAAKRGQSWEK